MKNKWKKRYQEKTFLAGGMLAVLMACFLFGNALQKDSLVYSIIRQGKSEGYFQMLKTAVPSIFYTDRKQSFGQFLMEQVFSAIPAYSYITKSEEYTTQMESDISYEAIIAREAMDENYVDEGTGELVTSEEDKGEEAGEEEKSQEESLEEGQAPPQEQPQEEPRTDSQEETAQVAKTAQENAVPGGFIPNNEPVVTYPMEKLNDFDYLLQNFYVVDRTTTINSGQLNAGDLLGRSMKLTHGPESPQILIYHTHSQEGFVDSTGDASTSIVGVGDYLTRLLEGYGFHVLHHTGEYDVLSRDNAYSRAGPAVEQILRENPSIEIVIDLHRDGVAEGTHLVTEQGGKQMASIMFFNGLSRTTANGDISYLPNPYIQDNLAFSLQMQLAAKEYYPGFSRMIYLKGYRYNMHYCPKSLLVEVGAQTNTVQEAMNAMEPLADILAKVITPK